MSVASQAPGGLQFRADDCSFYFIYIANEILWYFWSLSTFASEMVPGSCICIFASQMLPVQC